MSTPVNCGTSFCSCIECVDEAKLNRLEKENKELTDKYLELKAYDKENK